MHEKDCMVFLDALNKNAHPDYDSRQISALIDLTLLDQNTSIEALQILATKGKFHEVAALCVYPNHLLTLASLTTIPLATVVNFPDSEQSHKLVLSQMDDIFSIHQHTEIDYVFPYKRFLQGETELAIKQCEEIVHYCQTKQLTCKVILETGALPSMQLIYELSKEVIKTGCDFIKTSTGKINQGATPTAAYAILYAIKESNRVCGLKISGGIKTRQQACLYMAMAQTIMAKPLSASWFRIGASSLVDELK